MVIDLAAIYEEADARGEVVVVISGATKPEVNESELSTAARDMRSRGRSSRDVMEQLMVTYGASRNVAYKLAHESES